MHRLISDTLSSKTKVRIGVASEVSPQHGAIIGSGISAADRGCTPQTHPACCDYCVNGNDVSALVDESCLVTGFDAVL